MAGIGLFLVTSAVGRAWCGYACPQTVWTDLFQHVDRLVDGDRNAQIRLANGPWTAEKIAKRTIKYAIYLTVAFRSEEHTSELQSLMRISYAVFCLKKKT